MGAENEAIKQHCKGTDFTFTGGKFVLLHGFVKKTMKTPPAEIEKAKTRRDDYIRRFGK